jgi:hypothetical protein
MSFVFTDRLERGHNSSEQINSLFSALIAKLAAEKGRIYTTAPKNAKLATATLTISGAVIHGETFTLNGTTAFLNASGDTELVPEGNVEIDISATAAKAQGTLSMGTQPTAGDTMTVGSKVYTFVPDGTANADGEITVGSDLAAAKLAVVAAINGTDAHNTAHTDVTAAAFVSDDCILQAKIGGTAGNAIATTETFTAVGNVFDASTLGTTQAGDDTSAAEAETAILAATALATAAAVTMAAGTGDQVVFTTATGGVEKNAWASTETMANAAFGAATFTGGLDGTEAAAGEFGLHNDAGTVSLYFSIAENDGTGQSWYVEEIALAAVAS